MIHHRDLTVIGGDLFTQCKDGRRYDIALKGDKIGWLIYIPETDDYYASISIDSHTSVPFKRKTIYGIKSTTALYLNKILTIHA